MPEIAGRIKQERSVAFCKATRLYITHNRKGRAGLICLEK
jgi:hypothetical protein